MRSQILKGFTMFMLVVGVAFVSAVGTANAQGSSMAIANVPFEFIVGDKVLPVGKYTVNPASTAHDVLLIKGQNAKGSAYRLSNRLQDTGADTKARLVFHRYGERYFLSEVWMGDNTGRQLTKSRQERSIESQLAANASQSKTDVAKNAYERVEIVAMVR